ncbi:MAG: transglycosylase SLT domain-containing protein [Succinivibrionaceae bacterium]|nr:transglycosylase SLT domain-containing protein [Succinivibrionaceae bacterium]
MRLLSALLCALLLFPGRCLAIASMTDYYTYDFEQLAETGVLRILVVYDGVNYYFVDGHEDGFAVAMGKKLQTYVNDVYLKKSGRRIDVQYIPVRSDQLFSMLDKGVGDIAAGFIIPTQRLKGRVAFTDPFMTELSDLIVTRKGVLKINSIKDLSGRSIYIRKSSKAYETLKALNLAFRSMSWAPVNIVLVQETQQDSELIQRVQNNEIPATVVSSAQAKLWEHVFPGIVFHSEFPISSHNSMNWAVRHFNYHLLNVVNRFVELYNQDTKAGKALIGAYFRPLANSASTYGKKQSLATMGMNFEDFQKFKTVFQKYGEEFGLDWRMLMSQAYQESSFNPNAKSPKGPVGLFQVSPSMAKDFLVQSVDELNNIEGNVRAATKYLKYIIDNYLNEGFVLDSQNQMAFALASYNAGPGRIRYYRTLAGRQGLDPDIWFGNVEKIVEERGLLETVNYVSSILKRYRAFVQSEASKKKTN